MSSRLLVQQQYYLPIHLIEEPKQSKAGGKRRNKTEKRNETKNKQMQNCANDCRRQDSIARTSVYLLLHFCCHRRVFQSRVHSFQFWFFRPF